MPDLHPILLQTKLHRPRLPHNLVTRWRLVEWLNHDIDHPLTLVCAPAGFGKTALVRNWLARMAEGQDEMQACIPLSLPNARLPWLQSWTVLTRNFMHTCGGGAKRHRHMCA